jgi:hypothetical protein
MTDTTGDNPYIVRPGPWEFVGGDVTRMSVPGGWLYRWSPVHGDGCMVFVPFSDGQPGPNHQTRFFT